MTIETFTFAFLDACNDECIDKLSEFLEVMDLLSKAPKGAINLQSPLQNPKNITIKK